MAEPIKVTRKSVVVPEWGNAEREEKDKIRVHHRPLTFEEQQELTYYEDAGKNLAQQARVMARKITHIENLSYKDENEKVVKVETGEDLVKAPEPLDELATELWLTFHRKEGVDKKKSR